MQPKLKVEYLPTADLAAYENNTRVHSDEQVDEIAASIDQFKFSDPIGVWTNPEGVLEVVEGHGRLMAARRLGIEEVPVIRLDHLDDDARRAYSIVHNSTTDHSEFDMDALKLEMMDLPDFEWADFGFEPVGGKEVEPLNLDEILEDEPMPAGEAPEKAKRGQVWRLGEHRLMCGDSSSIDDMRKLVAGDAPMMVFTDPPYGVAIGDKNKLLNEKNRNGKGHAIEDNIIGDTLSTDDLYELLVQCFGNLRQVCSDECSYYVSSPQGGELGLMMMMMRDAGLPVRHNLIWVKNAACFSMGRLDYDYRHEPIFYTWTKSHRFHGGYGNTVIDDTEPIDKMGKAELKEIVRAYREREDTSVIYCDKPLRNDLHPTMKPVRLVARLMYNSSEEGDVVADIFGGSGTTMIAAEQLGRKCRMMEMDPHYCDVIIERWERFTGRKAELAS